MTKEKLLEKSTQQVSNEYLEQLNALRLPKKKLGLNYVSLFCGGGGLDLGFALAGFEPAFSTDIIPSFCETIKKNLPGHPVEVHDMFKLSGKYVKNKANKKIDFIIGGPPCQSFSILGDRESTDDSRGQLVFEYARFISELQPQGFLLENVPGLLTVNGGKDWNNILEFFKKRTGYQLAWKKLNSAWFGAPQLRERVVLLGFKRKNDFAWPEPLYGNPASNNGNLRPWRTSKLALAGVDGKSNHVLRIHTSKVASRYSKIAPGDRDRIDHTDRIHPEKPSGTVLVGSGAGGGRPFIHPFEDRHITVREGARLQSFPDWWHFHGGSTSAYRQVGNAVPPLMAYAIAKAVSKSLVSKKK